VHVFGLYCIIVVIYMATSPLLYCLS